MNRLLSNPTYKPPERFFNLKIEDDFRRFLKQFSNKTLVKFAIGEAKLVLPIYEDYSDMHNLKDDIPRKAIEAIEKWLEDYPHNPFRGAVGLPFTDYLTPSFGDNIWEICFNSQDNPRHDISPHVDAITSIAHAITAAIANFSAYNNYAFHNTDQKWLLLSGRECSTAGGYKPHPPSKRSEISSSICKTNRPEHKKWSDTYFAASYAREAIIIAKDCKEIPIENYKYRSYGQYPSRADAHLASRADAKWATSKFFKVEEDQLKRLLEIFRKES